MKSKPKDDINRVPHIVNLNEDPLLNEKLKYNLIEKPKIYVTRKV